MLCKPNGIRVSARKRAGHAAEWAQEQNQRMLTVLLWVAPGRRRDKGSNQYVFSNISELAGFCASHTDTLTDTVTDTLTDKLTSPQIFRPGRRARCCGSGVSPRCVAASGPSGGWRWRPASPALPKAPTPTGCRSARPLCPRDAWQKVGESRVLAFDHTHHSFCISTSSLQLLLHILLLTRCLSILANRQTSPKPSVCHLRRRNNSARVWSTPALHVALFK